MKNFILWLENTVRNPDFKNYLIHAKAVGKKTVQGAGNLAMTEDDYEISQLGIKNPTNFKADFIGYCHSMDADKPIDDLLNDIEIDQKNDIVDAISLHTQGLPEGVEAEDLSHADKVLLYNAHAYSFKAPPVQTLNWNQDSWIKYIDSQGVWNVSKLNDLKEPSDDLEDLG